MESFAGFRGCPYAHTFVLAIVNSGYSGVCRGSATSHTFESVIFALHGCLIRIGSGHYRIIFIFRHDGSPFVSCSQASVLLIEPDYSSVLPALSTWLPGWCSSLSLRGSWALTTSYRR